MGVLKNTFQQSLKLHMYRWELNKKRTNAHIFVCTHKRTHISVYADGSIHTHIQTIDTTT